MKITLLSLFFLSIAAHAHQVVTIADGDTMTLLVDQKPLKIRLANIDAPEKKQPFGQRSKESLSKLCWGKDAKYVTETIDKYKRTVAVVFCDGAQVHKVQVALGMAWVYPKYNKDSNLPALQQAAKLTGLGLWADPHPLSPWEWRKAQKVPMR
ncbi:MAG: thermonuclease family protein [Herminiimonas sp.]|uniref:thermonuclease family protein n=1 Tax=Herminiimonas sp. TaxID=1926289 RepID=UPI00271F6439|nr:thermonuclease family protein [Herminiimonas sp.]MDO9419975.1 thermonuclease family protein [Herminiimonas sp.]